MEQRRHICKLCKKTFLSGKVLGGHMRSHGAKNSAKPEKKLKMGSLEIEGDEDEPAGYGLRANPKRSWKFSGSKVEALREEEILCKVCGKKFDSMKALFGHMRHHSGKERKETQCCKVCGKGFESLKALTAHTKSHSKRLRACDESEKISGGKLFVECQCSSETMGLIRRKRSKRLRYKIAPNSSFSSVNESAYVSEFGQEVFDGAICLMMISRIGINWGRISTVTESSSNNSLSVEVQSPGQKNGIMESKGGISVCDDVGSFKISKVKMQKLVDCLSDCENVSAEKKVFEFGENESGSGFSDEENIVKFKVPIDRFYRGTEYKMRKLDEESAFMLHEMKTNPTVVEMDVDIIEEVELGSMKSGLTKKARLNACDSGKNMINATQSELFADSEKKEHKCRRCDKVFRSYQALGGHQRGHKANKNCSVMKIEDCEDIIQINRLSKTQYNCNPAIAKLECSDNSVEQEMETLTVTGTESKGHTCSICLKVFATGQALGGHKRVHFGKDSETGFEQTQTLKQQISDICGAFDLSHAVELEEEKGDVEFKSWCVGDEHKHNLLVG